MSGGSILSGGGPFGIGKKVGILSAVGVAAAGIAAGVATERYLLRRSKAAADPYAEEAFGDLPASRTETVRIAGGLGLHVEIIGPDGSGAPDRRVGPVEPTVLFVHGFCLDMGTFHFQRTAFDGRYRMVFYDQPGHGGSERLDEGEYGIDALAEALRTVLAETVGSDPVILVGHSMGGMTIMALAERYPELFGTQVVGVALISTSAGHMDEVEFGVPSAVARLRTPLVPVLRVAGPRASTVVDRARGAVSDVQWLATRRFGFGSKHPSPSLVSYVERMNSATTLDVISRYLRTIYQHDRLVALEQLRSVPAILIFGELDYVTPAKHMRIIAEVLPKAEQVCIPDGGHVTLLEHADQVNEALAAFIDRVMGRDQPGEGPR